MQKLFLILLIKVMIFASVSSQRKSRGHIIIIGGSGGGKQVEEKIVPIPMPFPIPCPIQQKIQKIPMIIKYP